jgi:tRNA-dihydrouridine synthase B
MRLGDLKLENSLFLAPLSGISDYPFRRLAREMGCGLAFTEMVSAEGLLRKGEVLLKVEKDEHPVAVQIFGSSPAALAEAAAKAEETGADLIDLNMGCPAKKVVKAGAGADLMRFPEKVKGILVEVRKTVRRPFTIKIRSGWDGEQINAIQIAKIAEDCGIDAISLHPRTRSEGFRGRADWSLIRELKRQVAVPVIGNGDVTSPSLARRMLEETGCDGVMIGRGALGNPWIFLPENSGTGTSEGRPETSPSLEERRRVIDQHFSLLRSYYGEQRAVKEMRKHIYWYTKGLPCCASLHSKLSGLKEKEALFAALESFFKSIGGREAHAIRSCR